MSKVFNLPKVLNITNSLNSGAIGAAPWEIKSLLESGNVFTESNRVKKYEIIEIPEDLLALSCAWYRIRQEIKNDAEKKLTYPTISSLLNHQLFDLVCQEDKEKADKIRDYYSKKIMMLTLLEIRLTAFREDLKDFLHGDSKKFKEKFVPMVYRLPEFYETDLQFEKIKSNFDLDIKDSYKFIRTEKAKGTLELTPIASLKKENKTMKRTEYWMKTKSNIFAYALMIEDNNPLKSLWDREFKKDSINMECSLTPKIRDGLHYYILSNYTVT